MRCQRRTNQEREWYTHTASTGEPLLIKTSKDFGSVESQVLPSTLKRTTAYHLHAGGNGLAVYRETQ